eukprot:Em0018g46a
MRNHFYSSTFFVLFLLFLHRSAFNALLSNTTVSFCNSSLTPLVIDAYTITPNTPARGKPINFTLEAELQDVLVEAKVEVNIKFGGTIPVYSEAYSLCSLLKYANLSCPVNVGSLYITSSVVLPDHVPSGFYLLDITISDINGTQLLCTIVSSEVL